MSPEWMPGRCYHVLLASVVTDHRPEQQELSRSRGVDMYLKGKRDSPKREGKKKPKLTIKEKRKKKKEKRQ
jgi:hypothetical protein